MSHSASARLVTKEQAYSQNTPASHEYEENNPSALAQNRFDRTIVGTSQALGLAPQVSNPHRSSH